MSGIHPELHFTFALCKGWLLGSLILAPKEVPRCYRLGKWWSWCIPGNGFLGLWRHKNQTQSDWVWDERTFAVVRRKDVITQGARGDRAPEHKQTTAPQRGWHTSSDRGAGTSIYRFPRGLPFSLLLLTMLHRSHYSCGKGREALRINWSLLGGHRRSAFKAVGASRIFRAYSPCAGHLTHTILFNTSMILLSWPAPLLSPLQGSQINQVTSQIRPKIF